MFRHAVSATKREREELLALRTVPVTRPYPVLLELNKMVPHVAGKVSKVEGPRSGVPSGFFPDTASERRSLREPCSLCNDLRTPCTPEPDGRSWWKAFWLRSERIDSIVEELQTLHALEWALMERPASYSHLDMMGGKASIDASEIEKVWIPLRNALANSMPDDMLDAVTGPIAWKSACSQVYVMMTQAAQSLPEIAREWLLPRVEVEVDALLRVVQSQRGQRLIDMWRDMPEAERSRWEAQAANEKTKYETLVRERAKGRLQHEPMRPRAAFFLWVNAMRAQKGPETEKGD